MNLEDRSKKILFTILSIPTIYMFTPMIKMFPVGLGLKNLFISAVIFGLAFGLMIYTFHLRKTKWPIKFSGLLALIFFGLATFNSGFDTDKKKPNSLVYVQNTTENKAFFLDGVTRDISMKGLFAKIDSGFPEGTKCMVEIVLTGKTSEMTIKLTGVIVRQDESGCGIHFESDLEWWPVFSMHMPRDRNYRKYILEEDAATD